MQKTEIKNIYSIYPVMDSQNSLMQKLFKNSLLLSNLIKRFALIKLLKKLF